jgi:hypothetical protein
MPMPKTWYHEEEVYCTVPVDIEAVLSDRHSKRHSKGMCVACSVLIAIVRCGSKRDIVVSMRRCGHRGWSMGTYELRLD